LNTDVLDKVRRVIARYSMLSEGDAVLAAVSGGPDSVALLHIIHLLSGELGISLSVAHLNHGIRGREADSEASFVQDLAQSLRLQAVVRKVDLRALRKEMKLSMQEAARVVRYSFLEETAKEIGANKIALGHTADDRVETVLLNIVRGTGIDGLAGIPPVREQVVRPLIALSRLEILEYLGQNSLPYRTDPTNLKPDYARNRVRLELIPLLESRFNPRVRKALLSLSEIASAEADLARHQTEQIFSRMARLEERGICFQAADLAALHEAEARRVLRMAIERARGSLRDIDMGRIEDMLDRVRRGEDFGMTLPSSGVKARFRRGVLCIFRPEPPPQEKPPFEYPLNVPGRTEIAEAGLAVVAEFGEPGMPFPDPAVGAVLDAEKISGGLVARSWRHGDRMRPLGLDGTRKLHDMFIDARVPRDRRPDMPVITDAEKILWVPGLAISELAKVDPGTRRVLRLSLGSSEASEESNC